MFPDVPTPNTSALFNQLQSGGATPDTISFHQAALSAARQQPVQQQQQQQRITSQPQDLNGMDLQGSDANDAANGLFLLAQSSSQRQPPNHYAPAQSMSIHAHPNPQSMNMNIEGSPQMNMAIRPNSVSTLR